MTLPLAVLIICVKERNQKIFTFVARQSPNYNLGLYTLEPACLRSL